MGMKKRFKQRETDVIMDGVVYRLVEGEYGVYTYTADLPSEVTVVSEIHSIPVTALLEGCFSDSQITNIQLPSSLKIIERGAFRGCKELMELKVPDNVYEVCGAAFKNCKGLKRLELGKHTKTLGWNLCEGCKSIEDFIVWDEVESFGSNMFWCGGKHLKYTEYSYGLYLGNPDNPYVILEWNVGIDSPQDGEKIIIDIHPNTKFVSSAAFNRFCDGAVQFADIDEVVIHDGILKIDNGAFSAGFLIFNRETIDTVRADNLETLCRAGGGLLGRTKHLVINEEKITDLVIPKHIHKIACNTFHYCSWLKTVIFEGDDITIERGAFYHAANLTEVKFPQKVTEIGSGAFEWCRSLKRLELYTVDKISYQAFEHAGLKSIVFHGPVGKIYENAFAENPHLDTVIGFENVNEIEPLHGITPDPFVATPMEGKYIL
ncbi:MAG: leucine-rich repeat domain-containing protein [Clostridia bacterium]|nr:leucine-rich repeat domain-containing protein [Clostridia bacterium]